MTGVQMTLSKVKALLAKYSTELKTVALTKGEKNTKLRPE